MFLLGWMPSALSGVLTKFVVFVDRPNKFCCVCWQHPEGYRKVAERDKLLATFVLPQLKHLKRTYSSSLTAAQVQQQSKHWAQLRSFMWSIALQLEAVQLEKEGALHQTDFLIPMQCTRAKKSQHFVHIISQVYLEYTCFIACAAESSVYFVAVSILDKTSPPVSWEIGVLGVGHWRKGGRNGVHCSLHSGSVGVGSFTEAQALFFSFPN